MALADLLTSPDPVLRGIPMDQLPPDAMDAYFWLVYRDDLRDQGVPESQIMGYQEWKAGGNG